MFSFNERNFLPDRLNFLILSTPKTNKFVKKQKILTPTLNLNFYKLETYLTFICSRMWASFFSIAFFSLFSESDPEFLADSYNWMKLSQQSYPIRCCLLWCYRGDCGIVRGHNKSSIMAEASVLSYLEGNIKMSVCSL